MRTVLSADATQFHATMRKAAMSARAVGEKMGRSMNKAATSMANIAKSAGKAAIAVGGVVTAAAAFGAAGLVKSSLKIAANFEQISVTMANFVGGAENAAEILAEVSEFSTVTPFETTGLQETVNLLLGAGIAADDAVDVMKELAAVSKNTGQVGELGDALAKGFAKGKFQTEELNKFLERGINLMPELAKVTGKTGVELQKSIQAGLKFEDVRKAIAAMSAEGGLFFGMLEEQSTTTTGLVSTLSSNWDEFRTKLGGPINDQLKPLLDFAIKKMQELTAIAPRIGESIGSVFKKVADTLQTYFGNVDLSDIGPKFLDGLNFPFVLEMMKRTFEVAGDFLGNKLVDVFTRVVSYLGEKMDGRLEGVTERFFKAWAKGLALSFKMMINPIEIAKAIESGFAAFENLGAKISDGIVEGLAREDVFGLEESTNSLKELFKDIVKTGEEKQKNDSEAPKPVKDKPKSEPIVDGKVFAKSTEGRALEATFAGASQGPQIFSDAALKRQAEAKQREMEREMEKAMQISQTATQMVGHHQAGFTGLAGASRMQLQRMTGVGVGTTGAFAQDRARLGIGSGLTTGGLGEKRAVGRGKDEAEMKRQAEMAKSSEEHLMEIKETIGKSLSVS